MYIYFVHQGLNIEMACLKGCKYNVAGIFVEFINGCYGYRQGTPIMINTHNFLKGHF